MIPKQLQNKDFRFILIATGGLSPRKRPLEVDWQNTNNYPYSDYKLNGYINEGKNYGVVCGYGNLAVIDADDPVIARLVETKLPPTFTIRTGSGGVHYYYIVPDLDRKIILKDKNDKHYGEIQWRGSQVIGPGSTHPNGNKYTIAVDVGITEISKNQIESILQEYIKQEVPPKPYSGENNYGYIDVSKICPTNNFRQKGSELQGKHPVHGSSTGGNFCLNVEKGLWRCFRCNTGGGPITLIAMLNGLIKCSDAKPGCITPEIYQKVIQIAKEKYGIVIEE